MILVTGGTGFVGSHIVRALCREGHEVRCLVRSASRVEQLKSLGAQAAEGDITVPETLPAAMQGVETVIHLVGIIRETRGATFDSIHAQGTTNVVQAARQAGVQRIIHMSALGTGPEAKSNYHKSKWRGEESVRASGIPYCILRPSIVVGPEDKFVNLFWDLIRKFPVVPVVGSGKARLQPIFVDDLAAFVNALLARPEAWNKVYEIGGPDAVTYDGLLDLIMDAAGLRKRKAHIPVFLVWPMVGLMEALRLSPPVTIDQLKMLETDNVCESGYLTDVFGLTLTPLDAAIRTYLRPRGAPM